MIDQLESLEIASTAKQSTSEPRKGSRGSLPFAFAATVFLSAFLLFQVQLIIGKYILPLFGGAPSVWNTCMLFFQVLLLLGYAYSHFLSSRLSLRMQGITHAFLLTLASAVLVFAWWRWATPLTPGLDWKPQPGDNPVWKILQLLTVTVAAPFFLLSTTSPLLQSWFARTQTGNAPYRLYALSNAGSLLGLLSYPFLLEWLFTLKHQAHVWSSGYVVFIVLCAGIVWAIRSATSPMGAAGMDMAPKPTETSKSLEDQAPKPASYLLWLGLSACSSTILLATTNLLCQDLAVIPLLWVVPLSLYLLSFILTFESNRFYRRSVFWPLYFLVLGMALRPNSLGYHGNTLFQITICCVALLVVCMVCHGELARSKPSSKHLTAFFFMIATGGALGGIFVVIVAPAFFSGFWEFPIALLSCGLLLFLSFILEDPSGQRERTSWIASTIIYPAFLIPHVMGFLPRIDSLSFLRKEYNAGLLVLAVFLIVKFAGKNKTKPEKSGLPASFPWQPISAVACIGIFAIIAYSSALVGADHILSYKRNFFGVKYVYESPETLNFVCGSTVHGAQFKDASKRNIPTIYFRPESGIGLLLSNYARGASGKQTLRIGTVGLGIGTLASYGRPGDYFRFYEIDPAVPPLSMGPRPYFEFVKNSPASVELVMGDGRLSLEREAAAGHLQNFDILIADAFSSDAVPVHLLTREAVAVYLQHLRPSGGVLAFNISNRFLELAPVIAGLGEAFALNAVEVRDQYSLWIFLSRDPELFRLPNFDKKTRAVTLRRAPLLWTDDYSNLFAVLGRHHLAAQ